MIFVSSSCVKHNKIKNSVEELAINGFKNIELSGGTQYYDNFENDLLGLKDRYGLNYRCHNYFPPPKEHFVLNLASLNDYVFKASFDHLQESIALSSRLGAERFAFHAGYFIDIKLNEIGQRLSRDNLFNESKSVTSFCNAFQILKEQAGDVELFIENNVFSAANAETFNIKNPFMLTSFNNYISLKESIDFNLLLDVAHLKVSAKTLGLNFEDEFEKMMNVSSYIHISNNDGLHDSNNQLKKSSHLLSMINSSDTDNKDFTLEVYDGIDALKHSHDALELVTL